MKKLTDQEIIDRLIARDNAVTKWFFYTKCQPLFGKIIFRVFDGGIEYEELVNMVYDDLMRNDAKKLRQFQFRSTLTQYIKVIANNLAIQKKDEVIDNTSKDYLYEQKGAYAVISTEIYNPILAYRNTQLKREEKNEQKLKKVFTKL